MALCPAENRDVSPARQLPQYSPSSLMQNFVIHSNIFWYYVILFDTFQCVETLTILLVYYFAERHIATHMTHMFGAYHNTAGNTSTVRSHGS